MRGRIIVSIAILLGSAVLTRAQREEDFRYMRSSLCMMMTENPLSEFKPEIKATFQKMEVPNRFNDHSFGKVRVLKFPNRDNMVRNLEVFAEENQLGKRLVSKWFGHNLPKSPFNTNLLRERGLDNATKIDIKEAMQTERGKAKLEDMGENLIKHTYWVVTDFEYKNYKGAVGTITDFAKSAAGGEKELGGMAVGLLMDDYEGYKMKAKSYLFRLNWNDEIANTLYTQYYTEDAEQDADKLAAYQADRSLFSVEYIGMVENTSTKMSLMGIKTKEQLIEKICTRSLDKNLADLQHHFSDFRIKAPLVSTSPLKAYIGMKEDITPESRYEVLLPVEDERGITTYKRVGIIKPIKGRIWDNQYMANLENTAESALDATYFEKVSGGDFFPGMLIREM